MSQDIFATSRKKLHGVECWCLIQQGDEIVIKV